MCVRSPAGRQSVVMRVSRRRQLTLAAAAVCLALGFCGLWNCVARLLAPRGSVRGFEVHGSLEFHGLLQVSSTAANCSGDKQLKMELTTSDRTALLDIRDFEFQMNQPPCKGSPVLVTLVHSAPQNREKRVQIRNTWGTLLQGALFFVLGQVDSPLLQVSLESENDRYHDMLQGSFKDAYRNMTYKHVMSLKWALYFCPGARYVLKADDDTFVNTPVLLRALTQGRPRCGMKKLMLCRVWSGVAVKRTGDKWTVTREEFSGDVYPDYCSGTAILYSQDVVYALYRAAQRTPYFWVDDVHITGTLAKQLNLTHQLVTPGSLGISFYPNRTISCGRPEIKGSPPWIESFVFSRHNVSASDMGTLWWYVKNCAMPS